MATASPIIEPTINDAGEAPAADYYGQFADCLVRRGKAREAEINRARRLAVQADDQPLPALLLKLGIVSERDAAEALCEVSGLRLVAANDYPPASPLPETVATRFLKENRIIGLGASDAAFEVAMADPLNLGLLEGLELALEKPVTVTVGLPS